MKQYIWLSVETRNESYRFTINNLYLVNNELIIVSELTGDKNAKRRAQVACYCDDMLIVHVPDADEPFQTKLFVINGKEAVWAHRYHAINSIAEIADLIKDNQPLATEMHPARAAVLEMYQAEGLTVPGIGFYAKSESPQKLLNTSFTPKNSL